MRRFLIVDEVVPAKAADARVIDSPSVMAGEAAIVIFLILHAGCAAIWTGAAGV